MVDTSDIVTRLEAIADELGEMSMNLLTQAIQDGLTSRPMQEKSVTQARRAVEKALSHLSKTINSD
jgi:predicted transcriptional regulator